MFSQTDASVSTATHKKNKTNPADTHETCYAPLSKVACLNDLNDLNDLNGSRLFFSFGFPEVP